MQVVLILSSRGYGRNKVNYGHHLKFCTLDLQESTGVGVLHLTSTVKYRTKQTIEKLLYAILFSREKSTNHLILKNSERKLQI
jgi:hypothetical protein